MAPALATWAGAFAAVTGSWWLLVVALLVAGAALRGSRWILVAALACATGGALAGSARVAAARAGPLPALAAARAEVQAELVVTDDPVAISGRVVGARRVAGGVVLGARLEAISIGPRRVRTRHPVTVLAAAEGWRARLPGERVVVGARLGPPRPGDPVAAVVRPHGPPRLVSAAPWWGRAAGRIRAGLRDAVAPLPAAERGLLPGLVIGDTSRLDPQLRDDFRATGLSHLVAVSGTNVAIVLAAALLLARRLGLGPRLALLAAAVALLGFVVLARPSPSVLRAAVMGALALLATATDRVRDGVPLLAAAAVLLLLVDPVLARSPGFALSTAATAGLLLLAPGWRTRLSRCWPPWLATAVAVPLAAQVACTPVLAAVFGVVSLVAVPANLLAMPAVAAATVGGVATALLAAVSMPLAQLAARASAVPTWWLVVVARRFARVPFAQVGWLRGWLGALLGLLVLGALGRALRRAIARRALAAVLSGVLLAAVAVHVVAPAWPPRGWVLIACDVGQGDGLVLRAGGAVVVVDAGPDPALMATCLRRLRVRRVAAVVLTHLHADHVEGLPAVLRARVGQVLTGPLEEPAEEWQRVRAWTAAAGVPLRRAALGERLVAGGMTLDVLGPAAAFRGTASDPNNSSLVLRARFAGLTALLTGDAEQPAQLALLSRGESVRADVLKVAHHGSARQVPALLDAVGARAAITSVGADNPYGHPAGSTLGRLAAAGLRSYRTDRDGDIAVSAADVALRVTGGRRGRGSPPRARGATMFARSAPGVWCPTARAPPPGARAMLWRWPQIRSYR